MWLYDPIRHKPVPDTPEERVRQRLIQTMVGFLGYPKGLLVVEKELPFSKGVPITRRIDLLCLAPKEESLFPLLLIECKAEKGNLHLAEEQAFGYNHWIGAHFIAVANGDEIWMVWREKGRRTTIPFLPSFQDLLEKVRALPL